MSQNKQVDSEAIKKLLLSTSQNKSADLDSLFTELNPSFEIDTESNENLFRAKIGNPNLVTMGLKCSVRLQAQAYAAAIILTPAAYNAPKDTRDKILKPADDLLNWAIGNQLLITLKRDGLKLDPDHLLSLGKQEIPTVLMDSIPPEQRLIGDGLFRIACSWILLHELGHLKHQHTYTEGFPSLQQEKEADLFAAVWLMESATMTANDPSDAEQITLLGISVALLWLTVFNVFFGLKNTKTHPQGYDRLYQVVEQSIDQCGGREHQAVWVIISILLRNHMWAAGYNFDDIDVEYLQGDPKEEVNHLINRVSILDRKHNTETIEET